MLYPFLLLLSALPPHHSIVSHSGHPRQPTLPLIRVRVHYSDEAEIFNVSRFGFKFDGLVANTEDLVSFVREKVKNTDSGQESSMGFCENLINVDDVSVIFTIIFIITSPLSAALSCICDFHEAESFLCKYLSIIAQEH
ncbi:Double-strand break repair protein MRE11A [Portunus trituberculatus]|uniref:Double-strand break repair protein MRE11A n=1 Tax=Portunus trituberculatus TaxID=210409 RepID=A0A5B7IWQ0_PORTR|nr:Double-strand break repair protein MRE11A [Portunus trituberculatus]